MSKVTVIGAGLAGCEAAWQLAQRGVSVDLFEKKPGAMSPAHVSHDFAELVCSNSLRSNDLTNAVGLLKEEMRLLGSLIIKCADETRVPAGGALAVDRNRFSSMVTEKINDHPGITVTNREIVDIPEGVVIIATGPLTSELFTNTIAAMLPGDKKMLSFFDSAAPIVTMESVEMENAWIGSRYGKGESANKAATPPPTLMPNLTPNQNSPVPADTDAGSIEKTVVNSGDYINCPLTADEYKEFYRELINAETADVHGFETGMVFEGCVPIEVMAGRGVDTMRYGPLKPVGLTDPRGRDRPYAVVQLRQDNAEGTLYNLVGFQTHLKFSEQKRVFSMIPALKNAEFVRYGVMHRNTYLNSPGLLDRYNRLISNPRVRFAGQITGVEGYVESAASGLLTGIETAREITGMPPVNFPKETATGALALYISGGSISDFQPMNVNFGIISPFGENIRGKRNRNLAISGRALGIIEEIIKTIAM